MILGFTFSIAHGFEEVTVFWESRDKACMPISGMDIMLVTRAVTAATLVGVGA